MGAEQSTGRGTGRGTGAAAQAAPQKTCYYELLSVERTATDDEIKKAYRRKALELHPDRNLDDTANATRRFAEVQTAYEVLADPQERAWYDSHRDAILRGDSGTDDADASADAGPRYYNNVRVTSTEELYTLMGRFHSGIPFDDSATGFFGILEATFAQLALEEEAAASWDDGGAAAAAVPDYAPFGGAGDSYEAVARPFYRDWSGFATRKSFSWKDKYRLADAPDRAVRRLMDKENKKAREQAARDFNDAVRSLVAFVRKRDPRYVPNTQSEAERQQILRDSAAAQAARQRAANLERRAAAHEAYVAPVWAQPQDEDGEPGLDAHEGGFSSDTASEVQHEIECVVCNKSFKSEKQFEAHEKSKKHIKAVQKLKWQMKKENRDLQLDEERGEEEEAEKEEEQPLPQDEADQEGKPRGTHLQQRSEEPEQQEGKDDSRDDNEEEEEEEDVDNDDDEYAPREVVEQRFRAGGHQDGDDYNDDDDDDDDDTHLAAELDSLSVKDGRGAATSAAEKKMGKAKAKREKKAARQAEAVAAAGRTAVCSICSEAFASNTQLHRHLRTEHPAPAASAGKRKKKK